MYVISHIVYPGNVLYLFKIWRTVSVREKDRSREGGRWRTRTETGKLQKKKNEEEKEGGLSQLLFCCVSSDSGLGCTPSSLGKRFKTQ